MAACALRPRTVPTKVSAPPCATTTSNPVGSVISAASKRSSASSAANVPRPPSSSDATPWSTTSAGAAPAVARTAAIACSAATTPAFMSTDPQPWTRPSATTPANGSCAQRASPGATTSRWPLRHRRAAPRARQRHPRADELGAGGLLARVPLRTAQCAEVVPIDRGREPARLGERREPLDRATLVPGDAPLAHEARHVGGECGRIHRGQGALFRVALRFGRLKCHFRCCSVT